VLGDPALRLGDPFADEPDPAMLAVSPGDVLRAAAALHVRDGAAHNSGPHPRPRVVSV
jgi:hypothetical protein